MVRPLNCFASVELLKAITGCVIILGKREEPLGTVIWAGKAGITVAIFDEQLILRAIDITPSGYLQYLEKQRQRNGFV
jgi:hypothetical protein